ncbi:MAG TPA: 3-phosphoshikimate 1-carboxyvinyltransferase, partial [Polyangiaceae bacterium]|nr:3-phosphoshikimate 1-carboxyvinyltransferase [Polyangiaceae bacterium]
CDDSRYLTDLLRALGTSVSWQDERVTVEPTPLVAPTEPVFCGNAGTAVRFGSCLSLLCDGSLTIDGDDHMRERPIGALGDALAALGIDVVYLGERGCPPLRLERRRPAPAEVAIDTSLSSQYASGLMMVAPRLERGLTITLTGAKVSMPYVAMTSAMMEAAGATLNVTGERFAIAPGGYRAETIAVEPDWSAAAFLLAGGFVLDREVVVDGLLPPGSSLQGDAAFERMLAALRAPTAERHRFDLTGAPDLIAPLVAACLFADRPSVIRGAAHTRIKESDRVAVLATELQKVGAALTIHDDGLDVTPLERVPEGAWTLDPDDDHRMAMAFGIVSLRVPGITVKSPGCVSKSFPDFWNVLAELRS